MTDLQTTIEILDRLVAFPTVSSESNLALIEWAANRLADAGAAVEVMPGAEAGKANLLATIGPDIAGGVVLSGHTDVVPVDGQPWDSDPFTVVERDGKYFGRGTCDMKGFDALAIWALVEAQYADLKRPLQLALSFDEEVGCTGAPPMIEAMQGVLPKGGAVIVGEPSMMQAVTGHKGGVGFDTQIVGFEVHSSIFYQGVSAIHEGARLIQWANDRNAEAAEAEPSEIAALFDPPFTSWHVAMIEGGTAHNITAKDCKFLMGYRAVPGDDTSALQASWMQAVQEVEAGMKAVRPEAEIRVKAVFDVPPLKPEENGLAEGLVRQITGDNGIHVVSYGTEAGQFQAAGYSAVVCGPGDIAQAHQPNEFVTVAQFDAGHDFMRQLVKRLV